MKKVKKGKLWNTWDIWEEDKSFSSKLRRKKGTAERVETK